ncbi:MAG TPA: hypothetical protein VGP72_32015 [Planctomycetota bacterium]|jgi:hypothetical protein
MAGITDYAIGKLMNAAFGGADPAIPTSWWLALYTVAPTHDGYDGTEVSGGSYARKEVINNGVYWSVSGGEAQLSEDVLFDEATANWGTVVAWALFDDDTGGHMWFFSDVDTPMLVNLGAQARIPGLTGVVASLG